MKIILDNDLVFELNETQKKVMCHELHSDEFVDDVKRRLEWVLMHKYEQVFKKFKLEWDPKLVERGIEMIPTNPDRYAELVFSQPDYMCRKMKDEKAKQERELRNNPPAPDPVLVAENSPESGNP